MHLSWSSVIQIQVEGMTLVELNYSRYCGTLDNAQLKRTTITMLENISQARRARSIHYVLYLISTCVQPYRNHQVIFRMKY